MIFSYLQSRNHQKNKKEIETQITLILDKLETVTDYNEKLDAIDEIFTFTTEPFHRDCITAFHFEKITMLFTKALDDQLFCEHYVHILLNMLDYDEIIVKKHRLNGKHVLMMYGVIGSCLCILEQHDAQKVLSLTVQLLSIILEMEGMYPFVIEEIIKKGGVPKIMNHLKQHITLREDVLTLICALTDNRKNNTLNSFQMLSKNELVKIFVFEDIFAILIKIIKEGPSRKSSLGLDCIHNLVEKSGQNQKSFLQIHKEELAEIIMKFSVSEENPYLKLFRRDKMLNLALLKIVKIVKLLSRNEKKGLIPKVQIMHLLKLSLMDWETLPDVTSDEQDALDVVERFQLSALDALGELFSHCRENQKLLESYQELDFDKDQTPCCALVKMVKTAIVHPSPKVKAMVQTVLIRFMGNNPEGQFLVAGTIKGPTQISSSIEEGTFAGIVLSQHALGTNSIYASAACHLLGFIISQNSKCKEILLEKPYEETHTNRITFYETLLKQVFDNMKENVTITLIIPHLKLLCQFLYSSIHATSIFMNNSGHFLYYLELILESKNEHLQGLTALLIGQTFLNYSEKNQKAIPKKTLFGMITRRLPLPKLAQIYQDFQNLIINNAEGYYSAEFIASYQMWIQVILSTFKQFGDPGVENEKSETDPSKTPELHQKIKELESMHEKEAKEFEQKILAERNMNMKLQEEIESQKKLFDRLSTSDAEKDKKIDQLLEKINELSSVHKQQEESYRAQLKYLNDQLTQKQDEINQLTELYNDVDGLNNEKDLEISNLRSTVSDLMEKESKSSDEIRRLHISSDEIKQNASQAKEEIEQLKSLILQRDQTIDELKRMHEQAIIEKQKNDSLEWAHEKETLLEQIQNMKSEMNEAESTSTNLKDYEARCEQLENQIIRLTQQTQDYMSQNDELRRQQQSLKSELEERKTNMNSMTQKIADLEKENSELFAMLEDN